MKRMRKVWDVVRAGTVFIFLVPVFFVVWLLNCYDEDF